MSGTVKRPFVSKWLLLLAIQVLPAKASAQSVIFFTDRALGVNPLSSTPVFLSYAPVRVCSLPLTQSQPCLPLANITDFNGNALSNSIGGAFGQLTTDVVGRFTFGCSVGGNYQVQVASSGSNTPSLNYPITCSSGITSVTLGNPNTWTGNQTFQGNNTYSGAGTFTGNNTYSGTETLANLDAIQFVDGVTNTTVQQAVNKLPTGGGVVYIPPGTYTGPTTIPNGTRLISLGGMLPSAQISATGGVLAYGTQNLVILQYSAGLNISSVSNLDFENVVLDFTSNGANLTLTSTGYSAFKMAVINCGTTNPCLTLTTLNQSSANTTENYFPLLILQGGTYGLDLTTPTAGTSFVTENNFGFVQILYPSTGAVLFDKWCDSNFFNRIGLWYSGNINGLTFNGSTTTAQGVQFEHVQFFDTTGSGNTTGIALTFNPSFGNHVKTGVLGGYAAGKFIAFNSPSVVPTSYFWADIGNKNANIDSTTIPVAYLDTPLSTGSPSLFFQKAESSKYQVYIDASNNLEFNNGTQNQMAVAAANGGGIFLNGTSGSVQVTPQATASGQLLLPNPVNSPATVVQTVASGTATMTTAAITAGNCGTTVTVAATNVVTTDTITFAFNAAPAGSNAGLVAWPTTGNVNFAYCPNSAETPAAATVNWKVMR